MIETVLDLLCFQLGGVLTGGPGGPTRPAEPGKPVGPWRWRQSSQICFGTGSNVKRGL